MTNHTYDVVGAYVPTKEMGGGSGLKYAASTIIYLSKKKEKDGKEVIGNIIKAKTAKSRLSKENSEVETRLYYDDRGLDKSIDYDLQFKKSFLDPLTVILDTIGWKPEKQNTLEALWS